MKKRTREGHVTDKAYNSKPAPGFEPMQLLCSNTSLLCYQCDVMKYDDTFWFFGFQSLSCVGSIYCDALLYDPVLPAGTSMDHGAADLSGGNKLIGAQATVTIRELHCNVLRCSILYFTACSILHFTAAHKITLYHKLFNPTGIICKHNASTCISAKDVISPSSMAVCS